MARLDDAFAELEREGYFAKQNYQCCRTCGWAAARIALKAGGFSDLNAITVRTVSPGLPSRGRDFTLPFERLPALRAG